MEMKQTECSETPGDHPKETMQKVRHYWKRWSLEHYVVLTQQCDYRRADCVNICER